MPLPIRVNDPEHWWTAHKDDLPWLKDPDVEDGRQRHPDRDERDWSGIARAVSAAADALTVARVLADSDGRYAVLPPPAANLSPVDQAVVRSWFSYTAPLADPWSDQLTDGRHRLWCSWAREPKLSLPIRSDLLGYVLDFRYDPDQTERLNLEASSGMRQTPQPILARNPRLVQSLSSISQLK